MVKDKRNLNGYSEEYDIPALRELAQMSARYVARENGVRIKGQDGPDGTFSDFSCGVWELLNAAIRIGVKIGKGEDPEYGMFWH